MNKSVSARKGLPWVSVVLWMLLIFMLSGQPGEKSGELSHGVAHFIARVAEKVFPRAELDAEKVHGPVRKTAHVANFFVLGVLVVRALYKNGVRGKRLWLIAGVLCMLYALSDEFHQYFIPARGAQISDVLLDTLGSVTGIAGYWQWRCSKRLERIENSS